MFILMYDCYDKDEKPLGIFFEDGTKELLEHHPDVKYVRGMDAVTRLPVWHEVREDGLFSYKPKKKNYYFEVPYDWLMDILESLDSMNERKGVDLTEFLNNYIWDETEFIYELAKKHDKLLTEHDVYEQEFLEHWYGI